MRELSFTRFLFKILPFTAILLLLAVTILGVILYLVLISRTQERLQLFTQRVHDDLIVSDGKWDISRLISDGDFARGRPLYIITSEGFIVERNYPIGGLLDLSRFSLLNQYSEPATVEGVTSEKWRVVSKAIKSEDEQIGVVFASYYNPADGQEKVIDEKLGKSVDSLAGQISTQGENIDVSRLDPRDLPYDVSFQVVSRFNKVLFQSSSNNSVSRMPVYMDRSYLDTQLRLSQFKEFKDTATGERFLVHTTPIRNENGLVSGVIVTGESVEKEYTALQTVVGSGLVIGFGFIAILLPFAFKYLTRMQKRIRSSIEYRPELKSIKFIKRDCKLVINDQIIDIPYSSHQYYFCQALFQKPQKKWEVDELLEVIGEDFGKEKWRKVYDTMVALNKKTSHLIEKLFVVRDKRYFLNTNLLPFILASNT